MEGGSKPIKRSEELVSLSRDHHDGLLLSWKIRTGINKGIELKRIADYVLHSYRTELDKVELQKAGKIVNQLHERKENASWSDEFWLKGII